MPYGDNKSTTWDKSNLPSRHVSVGPGAGAAPLLSTTPWG